LLEEEDGRQGKNPWSWKDELEAEVVLRERKVTLSLPLT